MMKIPSNLFYLEVQRFEVFSIAIHGTTIIELAASELELSMNVKKMKF
jgi:hypothetical protein